MKTRARRFGGAATLVAVLSMISMAAAGPWGNQATADAIDDTSRHPGLAATAATSAVIQRGGAVQASICTGDHVIAIVTAFTGAVNGGDDATADAAEIAEFFPEKSYVGGPTGPSQIMDPEEFRGFGWNEFASVDPQEVAAYFSQQFSEHDLRLGIMRVNPTPEISLQGYPEEIGAFAISFMASSDAGVTELNGRGSVNCVEDTILSLQVGNMRGD